MSDFLQNEIQDKIIAAARTSLVNAEFPSSAAFRPRFISNDYRKGKKVISELSAELRSCVAFDFSVAFVTMSGIEPLLQTLKELEQHGVSGRILTTDYLAFSDPEALSRLDELSNIEVRMFLTNGLPDVQGFHTKGYIFHKPDGSKKVLIGSSNLTDKALSVNKEWNLEFTSTDEGELLKEVQYEFECLWSIATDLTGVIDSYRKIHAEQRAIAKQQRIVHVEQIKLKPNAMQIAFMQRLEKLIQAGESRALLISATGTGKTYASAFAMRHLAPSRILFLVHREQILRQSIKSYGRVFGDTKSFGLLTGNAHETDTDFVFATVQTMSKSDVMMQFSPDDFDCIVIDEVHRAGADSYLKIFNYFKPSFWLGMTASPDRPDGFNIYKLFNNVIAYEIRLQQAMEEGLLCPFHYFGITDLEIDGIVVDEKSEFSHLVCDERVDYILEQSRYYGYSGSRVKGLVFCSRRNEGERLAEEFTKRGYAAQFVSGSDKPNVRQRAIERLVSEPGDACYDDRLDFLISVDIFNEGVDIPEVNQVIMLRPTQSPIVFIQQLGRGLRRASDKEFVVIIDFIGNYSNNYMIPIALSGDRSYNKDTLRKYVMEGERVVPGCSSVHFDEISRQRIFESIDNTTVSLKMLKEKYEELKHKIGRVPLMHDFQEFGEVDPMLFVANKKSYYRFLALQEPVWAQGLDELEQTVLEFASRYFGNGMRPHELLVLRRLICDGVADRSKIASMLTEYGVMSFDDKTYDSTCCILDKSFVNSPSDKKLFSSFALIDVSPESGEIERSAEFGEMLENNMFRQAFEDLIEFGLDRYKEKYAQSVDGLALYEKYSRRDVCRLLNWEQDNSSTVYGYRVKHGTCPIFVTYNKKDDISESTRYADRFISQDVFSWMTRSRLTLQSEEVRKIVEAEKTGLDVRLFIKKSDSEGSDFYYFGKVHPANPVETVQLDDKGNELPIVNFELKLECPVRDDIYEYFMGDEVVATTRVA